MDLHCTTGSSGTRLGARRARKGHQEDRQDKCAQRRAGRLPSTGVSHYLELKII